MNNGAAILLYDAEGNVSGGDRSADPRGGIFGAQGYGGGVFDGSTGLGGLGDTVDCAATCAPLALLPALGPTYVALCMDKCSQGEVGPPGCQVPAACAEAVLRYPGELPPDIVKDFCGFPSEVQQSIAKACQSLAALPPGTKLPEEPVPPVMPGVIDPTAPQLKPPDEAGMGVGTAALIGVAALGVGWLLWGKKK